MTREDVLADLGTGFHTALRKAADSPQAHAAWTAIDGMDPAEWSRVIAFVLDGMESMGYVVGERAAKVTP